MPIAVSMHSPHPTESMTLPSPKPELELELDVHKALANHGRESLWALPLVAGMRRPPFLARRALPLSALSLFQPSTCFAPSQPRLPRQTALFGSKALISSLVFSLSRHSLHNCIHTLSRASGVSSLNSLKVRLKSLANPQLAHDSLYNPLTPPTCSERL